MAEITLRGKSEETKVLKVNIGKKAYNVPLPSSLSIKEMRAIRDGDEDGFDFFAKYIPTEVLEELTMDDFRALMNAWKSSGSDDTDVGE